jgi:predicted transposase YdaD
METDKQIHHMFSAGPHWLYELLDKVPPRSSYAMESITLKALERHLDGCIRPEDPEEPILIYEFQAQGDPAIYARTGVELGLVQINHGMRKVEAVIIFGPGVNDPKSQPWTKIIQSITLADALAKLRLRYPTHPLLIAFAPLMEESDDALESRAAEYYQSLKASQVPQKEQLALLDIFESWLVLRFKTLTHKEIREMLRLPSLKNTVAGQELWIEGIEQGIEEGRSSTLLRLAERKFGPLAEPLAAGITALHHTQAEMLVDDILFLPNAEALEAWLNDHKV